MTFETFDQSDEETWPDQCKDNDRGNDKDKDKDKDKGHLGNIISIIQGLHHQGKGYPLPTTLPTCDEETWTDQEKYNDKDKDKDKDKYI